MTCLANGTTANIPSNSSGKCLCTAICPLEEAWTSQPETTWSKVWTIWNHPKPGYSQRTPKHMRKSSQDKQELPSRPITEQKYMNEPKLQLEEPPTRSVDLWATVTAYCFEPLSFEEVFLLTWRGTGKEKEWKEKSRSFYLTLINSYLSFKAQVRCRLLQEALPDPLGWFGKMLKHCHHFLYIAHSLPYHIVS